VNKIDQSCDGDIIAYRVDTLCGDMTSLLTRNLTEDTVVPDNTIVTENAGKACILMEYHGAELKALVDHFHLKKSITGEGAKKVQL